MAGSRYRKTGRRYRTAKQRQQLKKAQLISAQKRSRRKKAVIGLAGGIAVAGIGVGAATSYKRGGPMRSVKQKAALSVHVKPRKNDALDGDKIHSTRKAMAFEIRKATKSKRALKNRGELVARNKARAHTPEQRAEAKVRRRDYMIVYNDRRKQAYHATDSVSGGNRPRKKRRRELKPRKRKTD